MGMTSCTYLVHKFGVVYIFYHDVCVEHNLNFSLVLKDVLFGLEEMSDSICMWRTPLLMSMYC